MANNEKIFTVLYKTPTGTYGIVPDAPLPDFRDTLGAGQGEWRAVLPRTWSAAGIPGDLRGSDDLALTIAGGTRWYVYVQDNATLSAGGGTIWGDWTLGTSVLGDPPAGLGQIVWQGEIEEISPAIGQNEEQTTILALPVVRTLADTIFPGEITFTEEDPVDVAAWFFDHKYTSPDLTWDPRNVRSGRTVTQTFSYQSLRSIVDFCTTASGPTFVNHVDERNRFRLWAPSFTTPTHVWQIGREVFNSLYTQTVVLQKNTLHVRGKGGIFVNLTSKEAIPTNPHHAVYNFPDISDQATLTAIAQALLRRLDVISTRASITLIADTGGILTGGGVYNRGYTLETIRPGDTVRLWIDVNDVTKTTWGDWLLGTGRWFSSQTGVVSSPQIIQSLTYHGGEQMEIDLATLRPNLVTAHRRVQKLIESALSQQVVA